MALIIIITLLYFWILCATQGSADPLNSAFHLTYNMVLNLLRVEEINPEYMLEKSFYQFQHYRALPGVVESKYICYNVHDEQCETELLTLLA